MGTDTLIEKITILHKKHFLPLQYNKIDAKENHVIIRCFKENKNFYADVIVCREDTGGHDYMDGCFYSNGDGIGCGNTFKEALKDLLEKTKKSIAESEEELTS